MHGHRLADNLDILHQGELILHNTGCTRSPGTVLEQGNLARTVTLGAETVKEIGHRAEDASVIGSAGKHHLGMSEGVLDILGYVAAAQVAYHYPSRTLGTENLRELLSCGEGASVNGSHGNEYALGLRPVCTPAVIELKIFSETVFRTVAAVEAAAEKRTVKRAYGLDVERGGLLEQGLHLYAVFADYVEIVPAGLAGPFLVLTAVESAFSKCTELSEGVGRIEDSVRKIIAHHHLRPVHHRGGYEFQLVTAQVEHVPLCNAAE